MITGEPLNYEGEYEDVNSDIHREYNILVFKYAELLSKYLQVTRDLEEKIDELSTLKEDLKRERVKYGTLPLPKMWE